MLECSELTYRWRRDWVLDRLSFSLSEGSITGLTGPNGAGKSTLFSLLAGELTPTSGEFRWKRVTDVAHLKQNLNFRRQVPMRVAEFLDMAHWGLRSSQGAALDQKTAVELFALGPLLNRLVSELSGGEWKRASLARLLMVPADLYLLDEPFNHLDLQTEERLGHAVQQMAKTQNKTFFIISHDWHAMDHFFDDLILLNKKILGRGSVRDMNALYINWRDPKTHGWMHQDA